MRHDMDSELRRVDEQYAIVLMRGALALGWLTETEETDV